MRTLMTLSRPVVVVAICAVPIFTGTMLAAPPALAADATTGTIAMSGSVAGRCLFTTPQQSIALGELAQSGASATAGKLDPTKVNGQTASMVGWCNNVGSSMVVTTTELTNTTTAPSAAFDNRISYTATATANGISASDSSVSVGAGAASAVNVFAGSIGVTLSGAATPNNGVLVAGSYVGNVTVTLSPKVVL